MSGLTIAFQFLAITGSMWIFWHILKMIVERHARKKTEEILSRGTPQFNKLLARNQQPIDESEEDMPRKTRMEFIAK